MFAARLTNAAPVKVGLVAVFASFGSGAVVVVSCCRHGVRSVRFVFVGKPTTLA